MERRLILPINDVIRMTSVSDSILCSILLTNEKTASWLMNHYIFMWFRKSERFQNTYALSIMPLTFCLDYARDCVYLADEKYTHDDIILRFNSYVEFLITSIEDGWYVVSALDQFYLRKQGKHFLHTSLIYGYDAERKVFYVRDHFDRGKFSCLLLSYEDLRKSFESVIALNMLNSDMYVYQSTRYRLKADEEIDKIYDAIGPYTEMYKREIMYALSDMYNSFPIHLGQQNYSHRIIAYETSRHGVESYNGIIDYLQKICCDNIEIDLRIFTQIRDHKNLMISRIEYWSYIGIIRKDETFELLTERYKEIYRWANICLSLAIKYNVKFDNEILCRITKYLTQIIGVEQSLIKRMLQLFSKEFDYQTKEYIIL